METMTLEIAIPKDLLSILGFSKSRAVEAIKEFSVLGLYLERRISSGKAAELLGMGGKERVHQPPGAQRDTLLRLYRRGVGRGVPDIR